jgi:formate C-acetyltransferase
MESIAVSTSTLDKLIGHTRDLQFGKVRKTTFYPLVAESFKQTEGQDPELRRALAFQHLMNKVEKVVLPHEKIGGSIIGMWPEVEQPSYESQYNAAKQYVQDIIDGKVEKEGGLRPGGMYGRWAMMARDHYDSSCEFLRMQTIIKHLQGEFSGKIKDSVIAKACEDFFVFDYGIDRGMGFGYSFSGQPWYAANHMDLAYDKVVDIGWGGIRKEVEEKARENPDSTFYKACLISLDTVEKFINDYAEEYLETGQYNPDYLRIGKALKHVASGKPRSFFEAVQLTWITHIICNMQLGSALSFGRFDQYIEPYYQMDKDSISEEEAVELIANCLVKVNEPKMRTVQSIIIGGTKRNGEDAYNDVTRLVLKASALAHFPYPNVSFRVNKNVPADLADLAIEDIKRGHGMPMLINDDVWVPNFIRLGHTPEDARDFYNMGCVEMLINHASAGWGMVPGGFVDYSTVLKKTATKNYATFDELYTQYLGDIQSQVRELKGKTPMNYPGYDALGSILLDGCVEKGVDMLHGGTRLGFHIAVSGTGLATAADSLSAIKYVVYDAKKMGLSEYLAVVEKNFEGNELLRQEILSRAGHFGNDGEVDALAQNMFNTMTAEVGKLNDGGRDKWVTSYFSYTGATSQGELTPTTPDGRLDGEPISDGLGPSQGRDISGPTKLMNSLLKLNYDYLTGALATNIRLNPSVFSTQGGTNALKDLLFTYLQNGGPQVQVNFVKKEDLEDAKLNPQKHQDLIVRVAGFCATFIELDDKIQNEIISRTEHE